MPAEAHEHGRRRCSAACSRPPWNPSSFNSPNKAAARERPEKHGRGHQAQVEAHRLVGDEQHPVEHLGRRPGETQRLDRVRIEGHGRHRIREPPGPGDAQAHADRAGPAPGRARAGDAPHTTAATIPNEREGEGATVADAGAGDEVARTTAIDRPPLRDRQAHGRQRAGQRGLRRDREDQPRTATNADCLAPPAPAAGSSSRAPGSCPRRRAPRRWPRPRGCRVLRSGARCWHRTSRTRRAPGVTPTAVAEGEQPDRQLGRR